MAGAISAEVCVDMDGSGEPTVMGRLNCQPGRSGEIFSFEYARLWLEKGQPFAFDPDLELVAGRQYPAADRHTFGIFLDSAPDRWGRLLMTRRELHRARQEGRPPRQLREWDYLLGVHDLGRLGALRFRDAPGLPFRDDDPRLAAPPLASLRELQAASLQLESHTDELDHRDYGRWLSLLVAPGSSLGGARPKASVRDEADLLCIAKFPSHQDLRDVGAWELVASRLAAKAGIRVAPARGLKLGEGRYTTFLVRRFDRTPRGGRIAFVSAMTLTQRQDGERGASYLELIDLLQQRGADTAADCEQLFRRVLFNILIHNTDDHLRNHGFFVEARGLRLSPAYDLNPSLDRGELALAIDEADPTCDVAVALAACRSYSLERPRAEAILAEVAAAVGSWREEAGAAGIPRAEQELMAAAFAGASP